MSLVKPRYRQLEQTAFQGAVNGQPVDLFTLRNTQGAWVKVCNYGARVVQIVMPDARGELGDVALGFNYLASLQKPAPHGVPSMGAFIGRYANRIANAQFSLDGKTHQLSQNSGAHCIHGGAGGSRYQVFFASQTAVNQLVLIHRFTPQNDGFPGELDLTLTYTLSENNALSVAWQATALNAPTVTSFTSHVFFNLAGQGSVANHRLQLKAAQYFPLNEQGVPTGELCKVADSPFDFRKPTLLGEGLNSTHPQIQQCSGYDHHFTLDGWSKALQVNATLSEASSGRSLQVLSTEPGLQLFTANGLDAAVCAIARHSGVCLEPSYFPDSPNQPNFPSTRLNAGETRHGEIVYAFTSA